MNRLEFIKTLSGLGVLLNSNVLMSCADARKKLNILVLGGTYFVGPSIVRAALAEGHQVTLFNRGKTNPQLFPDLRLIKGDREMGEDAYQALLKEKWDVVIDVWPERASLVEEATKVLSGQTDHYLFISSIAVYQDFQEVGLHEESETVALPASKNEWGYPEEKLAAEKFVKDRFPENHTIVRACAIKGWRDPALDLFYWCIKLNRDDAIIAPGSGEDPIQFVDVKDVGRFTIMALEQQLKGTFNCVGPRREPLLWREFLRISRDHFQSNTDLIWADEPFLREHQVRSFSDLPLWAPLSEDRGFMQISNQKIVESGFEFTPIRETLDDCLTWLESQQSEEVKFGSPEMGLGLDRQRELNLIAALGRSSFRIDLFQPGPIG